MTTDSRVLLLHADDNVAIASAELAAGTELRVADHKITLKQRVEIGHKFACKPIVKGEKIFKYRAPIGSAIQAIAPGEYVHTHNLTSDYIPTYTFEKGKSFAG
jgi:altronate dehydratase small subunit